MALASGTARFPSQMAKKLASSPINFSSMTTDDPAAPNAPEKQAAIASSAADKVSQITTPLPAAKPSALTTSGAPCIACIGERVVGAGKMSVSRRRNAALGADRLREGLRSLQLSRGRRGAEHCKPRFPQIVREAVNQWRFGANNDELYPRLAAKRSHLRMIAYIRRPGLRDGKDAAVAGGTVKSFKLRTLPKFPGQGMFAPAAADKKHIHAYFLA